MKKIFGLFLFLTVLSFSFGQTSGSSPIQLSVNQDEAFLQGCAAFQNEDWVSAMFFLKKAVTDKKYGTDEVHYMLIASEMYAGEYKMAESDASAFKTMFPKSIYLPNVQYQMGRCLHYLGKNDQSVIVLSDFCHENAESPLYASALFWIGECFFSEYNYDSARSLYERIVTEFPDDIKAPDAQARLDYLDQRDREEKLLYLLKVTGEEYLSSKEEYERQLKLYKTEDMMGLRKQLSDALKRIDELEKQLENGTPVKEIKTADSSNVLNSTGAYSDPVDSYESSAANNGYLSDDPDIAALKRKAHHLENYMGDKNEANLDAAMMENVYEKIEQ